MFFARATVAEWGHGVTWPGDIGIPVEALYRLAKEQAGQAWPTQRFNAWMKPFADKGVKTVTLANTGGTDHLSFDGVGLPGFQFIQDEVEYGTRTHHSNMDTYERVQEADMKLNAAVIASFVYHAANRPGLFPRKPRITP